MIDENNPTIKLGADCCRQLIHVLERVLDNPDYEAVEDAMVAINEARDWLGDSGSCEDGSCRR